jgi:hypothetical protein
MVVALSLATDNCGVPGARHLLDFDLMHPPANTPLPHGFVLNGYGSSPDGYELRVSERSSTRNLLVQNPHGPEPFDIFAWYHFQKYYPEVREIPLTRFRDALVIDLRDVQSVHDAEADEEAKRKGEQLGGPSGKFIGGTVHICWRESRK